MKIKGLATGIGSLPHKEAEPALDLIFKYTPNIPFWPQLPKRSPKEGMVAQFSENIPFLKIDKDGLKFDSSGAEDSAIEGFYEKIIANDIDYFNISEDFAVGLHKFYQRLKYSNLEEVQFIKCQVTGPFTFAASINDNSGRALLHNPVLMQAILKALIMKSSWQIKFFQKFAKKLILFIDEPYFGCFGSAYTPLNKQDVVGALEEMTGGIKQLGDVLIGLHCCGNTDWSIFTEVRGIDIINFDAFGFQERFVLYAQDLKKFLERGGIICWGIVPTQEFSGKERPDLLIAKLTQGIGLLVKKGLDRDLLQENLIISPSCGLGTLDTEKSGQIFRLLNQISGSIRRVR